jgi:diketogulonate reductase-like aldo/keto reductase
MHTNRRKFINHLLQTSLACSALTQGTALCAASSPMQTIATRPIPSSGHAIPVIGLGTWQTFDVESAPSTLANLEQVLQAFFALGGRLIDSSPMYGRSEQVAGQLLTSTKRLDDAFIATKVWTSGKADGVRQMQQSLAKLEVNQRKRPIDLMQVHNLLDVNEHLATLRDWQRAGKVRYIGVTHYTAGAYPAVEKVIAKEKLDFLQINYSVAEREAENRLLPLAKDRGIAVITNRPFAGGNVLRSVLGSPLPNIAKELGCDSWAQLMLRFVLGQSAVTCAIPATAKLTHLQDNMRLLSASDLTLTAKQAQAVVAAFNR